MKYILIVMFMGGPQAAAPFVAMHTFDNEAACKKAMLFLRSNHTTAKAECFKDEKTD